jgi:hypothetical protein
VEPGGDKDLVCRYMYQVLLAASHACSKFNLDSEIKTIHSEILSQMSQMRPNYVIDWSMSES